MMVLVTLSVAFLALNLEERTALSALVLFSTGYVLLRGYTTRLPDYVWPAWLTIPISVVIVTCAFAVFYRVAPQFWAIVFIVPVYVALVHGLRWTLIAGILVVLGHLVVEFILGQGQINFFEEVIKQGALGMVTVLAGWLGEVAHRVAQRQAALTRLATAINQSFALNYILTIAADDTLQLARTDALAIYVGENRGIELRAHRGLPADALDALLAFDPGAGLIERITQSDANAIHSTRDDLPAAFAEFKSVVVEPLRARDRVLGVLMLARHAHQFDVADRAVIQEIANLIATALLNAQVYDESQARARRMSALNEFAAIVGRELDVTNLQNVALRAIAEAVGAQAAWIMHSDPATGAPALAADYGLPAALTRFNRREMRWHPCACQKFLLEQHLDAPVQIDTCDRLARANIQAAHAGVPLKSGERLVGILSVLMPSQVEFAPDDLQMLSAMGAHLGVALERARLHAALASRHLKEQAALLQFSQDLAGLVETDRVLNRAVEIAQQFFAADFVAVHLLDDATGQTLLRAGRGWGYELYGTCVIARNDPLQAHVLDTGETIAVEDALTSPRFDPAPCIRARALNTLLLAPLVIENGALGTLGVYWHATRALTPDDTRLLTLIANQTALAFARARRHTEAETRLARLATLREIDRAITSPATLREQLEVLLDETRLQMRVDVGSVFLLDADGTVLHVAAQRGARHPELWRDLMIRVGVGASGWIMQNRQTLAIPDVHQDARWAHTQISNVEGYVSYLGTPLQLADKLIGTLTVQTRTPREFTRDEIAFFEMLAGQAAIAIQNARRLEETKQRAEEFGALYDTARQIANESEPVRLMEMILDRAIALLKTGGGAIHLYDSAQQETTPVVTRAIEFPLGRLPVGEGLVGRVVTSRQPLIVENYRTWEHRNRDLGDTPFAAMIAMPMLYGGELIGVLALHELDDSPRRFTGADAHLLELLAANAAAALRNALLLQNERAARTELSALYAFARGLAEVPRDLEKILDLTVQSALDMIRVTFVRVLLLEQDNWVVRAACPIRVLNSDLQIGARLPRPAMPFLARATETNTVALVRANDPALSDPERAALLLDMARVMCLVPLWIGKRLVGILTLYEARDEMRESFTSEKRALARGLGDQLASALYRVELFAELEQSYLQTVLTLANAVDAKDTYTGNHSEQISKLAVAVGAAMGMSARALEELRYAAILHDVGKIGVPDAILQKPGKLDSTEWMEMRRHPETGAQIIAPVSRLANSAQMIRHHHERYDGTGYPDGLAGDAIPLGARILTIVDSFSAIVDCRVYREGKSLDDALIEIQRNAGTQFDPTIVPIFLDIARTQK
jgi:GAF domain-containing protein